MKDTIEFVLETKGVLPPHKPYTGAFKAKVKLSWRETAKIDEIRRSLLGANPQDAGMEAYEAANAAAYLMVRLVEKPEWWVRAGNGFDLEDLNVLVEVHRLAVEAVDAEYAGLAKKAEDAKAELKTEAATKLPG